MKLPLSILFLKIFTRTFLSNKTKISLLFFLLLFFLLLFFSFFPQSLRSHFVKWSHPRGAIMREEETENIWRLKQLCWNHLIIWFGYQLSAQSIPKFELVFHSLGYFTEWGTQGFFFPFVILMSKWTGNSCSCLSEVCQYSKVFRCHKPSSENEWISILSPLHHVKEIFLVN